LKKSLSNGFNDYDEESVYLLLEKMVSPKKKVNFLFAMDSSGNKHEYFPDDETLNKILVYLQKIANDATK